MLFRQREVCAVLAISAVVLYRPGLPFDQFVLAFLTSKPREKFLLRLVKRVVGERVSFNFNGYRLSCSRKSPRLTE